MKTKLTTPLLAYLSKQISSGKVMWALLTLNEYLSEEKDPLLNCLREKAAKKIIDSSYKTFPYISEIIGGKKLGEFNAAEITAIRDFKEQSHVKPIKKVPVLKHSYLKQRNYLESRPRSLWISRRRSYVFVSSTKREASSAD